LLSILLLHPGIESHCSAAEVNEFLQEKAASDKNLLFLGKKYRENALVSQEKERHNIWWSHVSYGFLAWEALC